MLLAAALPVVRFDQPTLRVPLLGLSQYLSCGGVYSVRVG